MSDFINNYNEDAISCIVSKIQKSDYIILNVICNEQSNYRYIKLVDTLSDYNDLKYDRIVVNLNMIHMLKLFELTYLLSSELNSCNTKVAFVYDKLYDCIDSSMRDAMIGNKNNNLFSNLSDAEKWLLMESD